MTHMQRPGGIGRNIFHVDLRTAADGRIAVCRSGFQYFRQAVPPEAASQPHIDKTGPGDFRTLDLVNRFKACGKPLRQIPRFHPGWFGQDHRGIGRDIAMGWVARRFHTGPFGIQTVRQFAGLRHFSQNVAKFGLKVSKDIHDVLACTSKSRRCSSRA